MDYFKAFETLKSALEKAKIPVPAGHFAVQVRIKDDDCAGIFYIEASDGNLNIEPYDYYDHDVDVLTTVKDFKSVIDGKLDILKAVESGSIVLSGNSDGFIAFINSIPKKEKKAPAKKPAKKAKESAAKKTTKTSSKAAKKETEAVKVKEDTKKPETKDIVTEVVEKEIKPKKKTKK